jgi:hypothetical protein
LKDILLRNKFKKAPSIFTCLVPRFYRAFPTKLPVKGYWGQGYLLQFLASNLVSRGLTGTTF